MMDENNQVEMPAIEAEVLLTKLMYLKRYETPDASRMVRNKQNIMRQVRQSQSERKPSLLEMLEGSIPWFFAEPKYGIAALFIAFVALQYVGVNARRTASSTGIYTSSANVASFQQQAPVVTNRYPNLPSNYRLFAEPQGDGSVMPASFEYKP